jgi:exopolysaccharide biosynthesis protein
VAQTAQKYGAAIGVNGGFFDPRTGAGVGCLIDLGQVVGRVAQARRAVRAGTPETATAIRNRSELRLTVDAKGAQSLSVAAHDAPIATGAAIEESLQAGPALLPQYDPVKEGFIRKNAKGRTIDSIDTASRKARTAVGITTDGKLLLLTVYNSTKGPDEGGMTLPQVAALLKSCGAVEALNLDGGTSTSMYLRLKDSSGKSLGVTVSGNWPPRRVQSVLLMLPKPEANQDDHVVEQRCELCQALLRLR